MGEIMKIFTGRKNVNQTKQDGKYNFFSCSPEQFFSDEYICDDDALIITGNGSYTGTVRFFSGKFDLYQRTYACILNEHSKDKYESKFIYYFAKAFFEKKYMGGTRGSSIPYIVRGDIENYDMLSPSLPEQKAIAEILSSLDDKIDLLHRQNKILEDMAQTLFRQWFVEEADEGWESSKLGDVFTAKGGATPSTKESGYWNGNIHWTTPRDLSNNHSIFLLNTERKITNQGLEKISSKLLPIGTILLSSRAPIGYLAIAAIPTAINQGYIAICCDNILSNYFVYLWCKNNMEMIKASGNGSVFQEISKTVFRNLNIRIPPKKLLLNFDEIITPIFLKVKYNQFQALTLKDLRDNLLPQLMSGGLRANF